MRAGRLISLMQILQRRGRVTAADLASELEVSERTVLRDIEALSGAGVPVYATRGPGGGFQLLDGYTSELIAPARSTPPAPAPGSTRARVRITADGLRLAAVLGRPQPLRLRRKAPTTSDGWFEASFRLDTIEGAVIDVMTLGPQIHVLEPPELAGAVADRARRTADLYRSIARGDRSPG
jgi:predicted DNA-binding transcriptional regulator YafY